MGREKNWTGIFRAFAQRLLVPSARQQVVKPYVLMRFQQNCSKCKKKYVRRSPRSSHFPKKLISNSVQIIEQLLLCLTRKQDPSSDHTGKDPSEDRFDMSPRAEGVLCALVSPNFDSWSYWRPKRDFIKTWVDIPERCNSRWRPRWPSHRYILTPSASVFEWWIWSLYLSFCGQGIHWNHFQGEKSSG